MSAYLAIAVRLLVTSLPGALFEAEGKNMFVCTEPLKICERKAVFVSRNFVHSRGGNEINRLPATKGKIMFVRHQEEPYIRLMPPASSFSRGLAISIRFKGV